MMGEPLLFAKAAVRELYAGLRPQDRFALVGYASDAGIEIPLGSAGPQASVQHHYGLAGLKQANWNLTKAKHEFRVFEVAHISDHLDKAFASRMRERIVERNLHSYDLTNATKVAMADIEPFAPSRTHFRHIDPQLLTINFELYIYDGVVALLDYSPQAMQAIEIHHPALHAMMKQLFESMWNLGEPLTPS